MATATREKPPAHSGTTSSPGARPVESGACDYRNPAVHFLYGGLYNLEMLAGVSEYISPVPPAATIAAGAFSRRSNLPDHIHYCLKSPFRRSCGAVCAMLFILQIATLGAYRATAGAAFPQDEKSQWTLIWSDEFNGPDGSRPDPAKWKFEVGGNGWGND